MSYELCGKLNTNGMLSCQANPGCIWQPLSGYCNFKDPQFQYCYSTEQSICASNGCDWKNTYCAPKGNVIGAGVAGTGTGTGGNVNGYTVCGDVKIVNNADSCSANQLCVWQDTWCQYRDPNNVYCYSSTNQATCERVGCTWSSSTHACSPKAGGQGTTGTTSTKTLSEASKATTTSNYGDMKETSSTKTASCSTAVISPTGNTTTAGFITSDACPKAKIFSNSLSTLLASVMIVPGVVLFFL